jgi:hypothetical protein
MDSHRFTHSPGSPATPAGSELERALALLLKASDYAGLTKSNAWEFAVEIHQLLKLGLSENDLRFLVRSQWVEHACEITAQGQNGRQFLPTGDLTFASRTCFVLTSQGLDMAAGHQDAAWDHQPIGLPTLHVSQAVPQLRRVCLPIWDDSRRILLWDGQIVKRFKRRAINQELILSAFQEENWPERIDDPLTPEPCLDMKRRLNATIRCLNHGREHLLLHFRGDGTGQGVVWEAGSLSAS